MTRGGSESVTRTESIGRGDLFIEESKGLCIKAFQEDETSIEFTENGDACEGD